jgi:hypothetical protein
MDFRRERRKQMDENQNQPLVSSGLTEHSEVEISGAIKNCCALCAQTSDPVRCIEAYSEALIANGWSLGDAREVRHGAIGVLATIKHDESLLPPAE